MTLGADTPPTSETDAAEPAATAAAPEAASPETASAVPLLPVVLDGIKYTDQEVQGSATRAACRRLGIETIPIAYHGGVDFNESGEITERNIVQFTRWVDRSIHRESTDFAVMDYEYPWWTELNARELAPERLAEILGVYSEGLAIAKKIRPGVRWGYWGLPTMRNVSQGWSDQGLSVNSLTLQQDAVYPGAYDCNPDEGPEEFGFYIERVLESVQGKKPVWAFINTRYCGQDGDRSQFIPVDDVLANANAILKASWTDPEGVVHRAHGIVVWDTYGWSSEAEWPQLDRHNAMLFSRLHALTDLIGRTRTTQSEPESESAP